MDAARSFHAELLGWDYGRVADEGGFAMARRYGENVAVIDSHQDWERVQSLPAHWNNYVSG